MDTLAVRADAGVVHQKVVSRVVWAGSGHSAIETVTTGGTGAGDQVLGTIANAVGGWGWGLYLRRFWSRHFLSWRAGVLGTRLISQDGGDWKFLPGSIAVTSGRLLTR